MKRFKKQLSLIISFILVFSLLSYPCFADTKDTAIPTKESLMQKINKQFDKVKNWVESPFGEGAKESIKAGIDEGAGVSSEIGGGEVSAEPALMVDAFEDLIKLDEMYEETFGYGTDPTLNKIRAFSTKVHNAEQTVNNDIQSVKNFFSSVLSLGSSSYNDSQAQGSDASTTNTSITTPVAITTPQDIAVSYPNKSTEPAGTAMVTNIPNAVILQPGDSIQFTNNTKDVFEFESSNEYYYVDFVTYNPDNTIINQSLDADKRTLLATFPGAKMVLTNKSKVAIEADCFRRIISGSKVEITTDGFKAEKINKLALGVITLKPKQSYHYANTNKVREAISLSNKCTMKITYANKRSITTNNNSNSNMTTWLEPNDQITITNSGKSNLSIYSGKELFNPFTNIDNLFKLSN